MIFLSKEDKVKQPTAIAVGMFDGLHLGHRALIMKLKEKANVRGFSSLVFTFKLLDESNCIYTNEEKKLLLEGLDTDYVYMQDFLPAFLNTNRDDFLLYLKEQFHMTSITVGEDFRFGKGARGNVEYLQKNAARLGFTVDVAPSVIAGDEKVSSTRIRKLIAAGNMDETGRLLGMSYFVSGRVEYGKRIGSKIDFPTINIVASKLRPSFGVYATYTMIEGKLYQSVTNVGVRPTIGRPDNVSIETNIFDFNETIYDMDTTVFFIEKIRDEKKFAGLPELKTQIAADKQSAIAILGNKNVYKIY